MPLDPRQLAAVADQLHRVAAEIDRVGAVLAGDPLVAARHGELLQSIDLIAQQQQALASLLIADDFATAVGACRLDRLSAALAQVHWIGDDSATPGGEFQDFG